MIKTLIKSMRVSWASKNVNAYLLVLTYAYFSNLVIKNPFQILEGLILVSVLWGALYSLNDLTDLESDRKDYRKHNRAFIQNRVERKWVILFFGILVFLVFTISLLTLKPVFSLILALMLLNQLIYTVPPLRLKDTVLAPFTSTATNTILRMASCTVLVESIFLVPISVYLFMYMAGMSTYMMYKTKKDIASMWAVISCIILIYALISGDMNLMQLIIAVLPAFLATIPLYISIFKDRDRMVYLADVLYHKVAMVLFSIGVLIILFPQWTIERIS